MGPAAFLNHDHGGNPGAGALMSRLFLTGVNTQETANVGSESERAKRFEKFQQNHLHLKGLRGEIIF